LTYLDQSADNFISQAPDGAMCGIFTTAALWIMWGGAEECQVQASWDSDSVDDRRAWKSEFRLFTGDSLNLCLKYKFHNQVSFLPEGNAKPNSALLALWKRILMYRLD
jgi:hypothetical protein